MIKIYGIPNCNTVKKALVFLQQNDLEYEFHNFKKLGISKEKMDEWILVFGNEKLINRAGTTFKQLSEVEKILLSTTDYSFDFVQTKLSVIKRPILEKDNVYLIGFDEKKWIDMIGN